MSMYKGTATYVRTYVRTYIRSCCTVLLVGIMKCGPFNCDDPLLTAYPFPFIVIVMKQKVFFLYKSSTLKHEHKEYDIMHVHNY